MTILSGTTTHSVKPVLSQISFRQWARRPGYFKLHPALFNVADDAAGGFLLNLIVHYSARLADDDGWFNIRLDRFAPFGLSPYILRRARARLVERGLIEEQREAYNIKCRVTDKTRLALYESGQFFVWRPEYLKICGDWQASLAMVGLDEREHSPGNPCRAWKCKPWAVRRARSTLRVLGLDSASIIQSAGSLEPVRFARVTSSPRGIQPLRLQPEKSKDHRRDTQRPQPCASPIIHEPSEVFKGETTCRAPSATAANISEQEGDTMKRAKKDTTPKKPKQEPKPKPEKKEPWAARFAETFKLAYSAQPKPGWYCYGVPYDDTRADYVQLARLVKRLGDNEALTPEEWRKALVHYFRTPQGKHTLADLASRYDTFRLYPLDNFGKPRTNGVLSERGQKSAEAIEEWINDPSADAMLEGILGPNPRAEHNPKGLLR